MSKYVNVSTWTGSGNRNQFVKYVNSVENSDISFLYIFKGGSNRIAVNLSDFQEAILDGIAPKVNGVRVPHSELSELTAQSVELITGSKIPLGSSPGIELISFLGDVDNFQKHFFLK